MIVWTIRGKIIRSVLCSALHCWLGHFTRKNRPRNDL